MYINIHRVQGILKRTQSYMYVNTSQQERSKNILDEQGHFKMADCNLAGVIDTEERGPGFE